MKIINDPIYGLTNLDTDLVGDIIQHPLFQRLRRIKQLGLTHFVYPGAVHTRFQHSLGAAYLMENAINVLKDKGFEITQEERFAALTAILLHDLGHGPLSHTLENHFFKNISHETISEEFMKLINNDIKADLSQGIDVFANRHPKKLLHKLVSSQLDMDRLDYLNRDSFFTGVTEGIIGSDRIIKMLNVVDNELVIEAKGIYSVEKFLIARRLMYWQVYLHKTVKVAEEMLKKVIDRARELVVQGVELPAPASVLFFFKNNISDIKKLNDQVDGLSALQHFALIDDSDIIYCLKLWQNNKDFVLSRLSSSLINRNLFKIKISGVPFDPEYINQTKEEVMSVTGINKHYINYFVLDGTVYNRAYIKSKEQNINILYKDGTVRDLASASDVSNVDALSKNVTKFFLIKPECL